MILQVFRLKKSNLAWMRRIVMMEIRQPTTEMQMIIQETIRVSSELEKQLLMWYLKDEQRVVKSVLTQDNSLIEEFKALVMLGKTERVSFKEFQMPLQVANAESKVKRYFQRSPKRKLPLLLLEKRQGISVPNATFCDEFIQLQTISAFEYQSSTPLLIDSAFSKYTQANVVKLNSSVKLLSDIWFLRFVVRFIIRLNFQEKRLTPSQLQCGLPFKRASLSASSRHYVILRLQSIEGMRQALKQVKMSKATATNVKNAESGEVNPFSLIFQNFSLSENLISPILTNNTKRTRETKVRIVVSMIQKVLFLLMIQLTCVYEPVERQVQKAEMNAQSERVRKVLSWMMLKLQGSVALPKVRGAPPGQEGYCWPVVKERRKERKMKRGCMVDRNIDLYYSTADEIFIINQSFKCFIIIELNPYHTNPFLQNFSTLFLIHSQQQKLSILFASNKILHSNQNSNVIIIKISLQHPMKYGQAQLKTQLIRETINETTLYYSLVKKQGKTISFLSNDRLLIYDNTRKIIFYNNDFQNTPFRTTIPNPKNDTFTPLHTSTFKNPNNTNEIQVRYTGKNTKGELETIEWNFVCETEHLAKEWMRLFEEEKNRVVSKITGEKGAGFIHDTLLEAFSKSKPESPPKESILKPEERMIKTNPLQEQQSNVINSRLTNTKIQEPPKEVYNRPLQKSQIGQSSALLNSHLPQNSMIKSSKNVNQSNLSIHASQTKKLENSYLKPKDPSVLISRQPSQLSSKKKQTHDDWNHIFLRNSHESTIVQFQQAAMRAFKAIWSRDSNVLTDQRRVYESEGLVISVCNAFTENARQLKRQFRNYHFIIESCKAKLIIGVPLTCLIEWQGVVALAKAPLPLECEEVLLSRVANQLRQLQRYTRIGNGILQRANLFDASQIYGMNGDKKLIYVDGLVQYLPLNPDQLYSKSSLRPEYLLDSVNQIVPGGEVKPINRQQWKTLNTVCQGMTTCIKQLVSHLSNQETFWSHALELKNIFHQFGVNFKCLPRVYNQLTNKYVKKYVQTVMAAKVAKELIISTLLEVRSQNQLSNPAKLVEQCFRKFIEGNNSTSSELWKDLSVKFKKTFGVALNNNEILGGFFLNSLIKLLRVNCDMSKLNRNKKIFKEQGIVGPGFVISIQPKIKSYNRFTTEFIEKIRYACKEEKKDQEIYEEIVQTLNLEKNLLPLEYSQGQSNQCILEYLSYYTAPKNLDPNAPLKNISIYNDVLKEPPSAFTLKLTKTYLNWCIRKEKGDEFKKTMESALKIAAFWLEETHIYNCSLYELLSDYYSSLGDGEESINFMKESLSRCIRVCGAQSKEAGAKYYQLGERQLKVGHKKSALENFSKAKINMESHQNQSIKYPQLLMRLSALHLNNGNIQSCIEGALQAIKQFQEYDKKSNTFGSLTEGYKIKTFQVLSRAFQISGKKEELKDMAILCAKKFNKTRSQWAFQQMLRICLAAAIFKNRLQICQIFLRFIHKLLEQQKVQEQVALRQLMKLSEGIPIMQRFITRFQNIQRIISEGTSKRGYSAQGKDYVLICKWLANCVGEDYIQGLVQQKQFQ